MKFEEVYNRIIQHWDGEILITDGYPTGGQNGFMFPTLDRAFDRVEEIVGHENAWDELMVWTLVHVFWSESKRLFQEKKTHLKTKEVSLVLLKKQFALNLQCEGWENERTLYEDGET